MIFIKRHKNYITTINLSRICFFNDIRMGFNVYIYAGFNNTLSIYYAGNHVIYEYYVKIRGANEIIAINFSVRYLNKTFELNIIMCNYNKKYDYKCSKGITYDGVETITTIKKTNKHDIARNIPKFPVEF